MVKAIDGLGQHERQRVFSCAGGTGKDQRVGKAACAHALAQVGDGGRAAEEVLKAHGLRVAEDRGHGSGPVPGTRGQARG